MLIDLSPHLINLVLHALMNQLEYVLYKMITYELFFPRLVILQIFGRNESRF
jgi:hypothetical protein